MHSLLDNTPSVDTPLTLCLEKLRVVCLFIAEKILDQKNGCCLMDIETNVSEKPHWIAYIFHLQQQSKCPCRLENMLELYTHFSHIYPGCFLDNQLRLWCLYVGRKPGCSISDQAPYQAFIITNYTPHVLKITRVFRIDEDSTTCILFLGMTAMSRGKDAASFRERIRSRKQSEPRCGA